MPAKRRYGKNTARLVWTARALGIWGVVVVAGSALFGLSFLPTLNPPQCPSYVTSMPDGSKCIIGANLGAPLLLVAGLLLMVTGTVGLLIGLVLRSWRKHRL